jgi:mannitol/fructose-specific phosphotransferase system IIA component (Ntr-type)/phosphotransferase system HPr-like phosphotransfer protein
MQRFTCTLHCHDSQYPALHTRNARVVTKFGKSFPKTQFRISRVPSSSPRDTNVDPRAFASLLLAEFDDGDTLAVEIEGQDEALASALLQVILENLDGLGDDDKDRCNEAKQRLYALVDATWACMMPEGALAAASVLEEVPPEAPTQARSLAVINDRLHEIPLVMLPVLARYFSCELYLSFDHHQLGVQRVSLTPANNYHLPDEILRLDIPRGTRMTIETSGLNRCESNAAIRAFLSTLRQCDDWLRQQTNPEDPATVASLVSFALRQANLPVASSAGDPVMLHFLLSPRVVFINPREVEFTKTDALIQLAQPHDGVLFGCNFRQLIDLLEKNERKEPIIIRHGFAISHTAVPRRPRIAFSFGVYPNGISWNTKGDLVRLVCMALFASDTPNTWSTYCQQLARTFYADADLQSKLTGSTSVSEFIEHLRKAEELVAASQRPGYPTQA